MYNYKNNQITKQLLYINVHKAQKYNVTLSVMLHGFAPETGYQRQKRNVQRWRSLNGDASLPSENDPSSKSVSVRDV